MDKYFRYSDEVEPQSINNSTRQQCHGFDVLRKVPMI